METSKDGRVALVMGGARGIGEAIARALAQDGLAVVVADLRAEDAEATAAAIRGAGGNAIRIEVDVTSTESVAAAVAAAREQLGPVDVLVNNAGWDDLKPFVQTDEALWDRVIEVNYKGVLRLTHAVLPEMIDRGWGRRFFARDDAGYITGQTLSVSGGLTMA